MRHIVAERVSDRVIKSQSGSFKWKALGYRSQAHWQLLTFLLFPIVMTSISSLPSFAGELPLSAPVFKHTQGDGQVVQALTFRLPENAQGVVAHDHLIYIDTSASQIGAHRLRALAVLESMLKTLPASQRVRLFAVDVQAEPLMSAFESASSEATTAAVDALKTRIPLGATNLEAVIHSALESKAADRHCSITYIGDGISAADLLDPKEVARLVAELRDQRIPFHSYGVGPQINLLMLGALAHQTGGFVDFDKRIDADEPVARQISLAVKWGHVLAQAVQQPVVYPTRVELTSGDVTLLPLLPLRADRETVHLVRGALAADAAVTMKAGEAEETLNWVLGAPAESPNLAYISVVTEQSEKDEGLSNCLAGRTLMTAFQDWVTQSIKGELDLGAQQLKLGRADQAAEIARRVAAIDPQNAAAESLAEASDQVRFRQVSLKAKVDDNPVQEPELEARTRPDPHASLIQEQEQIIRVQTEKLRHQTGNAIGMARSSDPDIGLIALKQAKNAVLASNDIAPDDRTKMIKQLDMEISQLKNMKDKIEQDRVYLAERLSQLESQKRLTEQFELDEEKLEGLIERVRALMLEGRHGRDEAYGEAQNVADVAIDLRPGEGTSAAARFNAEAAQQLNRAYRLRARRADQLLDTLHQVELSHIPFPDEPPVRYPPADVWKALTERRRKWNSVDLKIDTPQSQRIRAELTHSTEVNFSDIPLKDALDYIEELHHIQIWVDTSALSEEGISIDATVNLVMSGVSLRSVLRLILEPLLLTYVIEDEYLKITTKTVADDATAIRVYPIIDLVQPIQQMGMGGMGGMRGGMGGMGGGMGGMGGGMMGGMGGMGGGMGGGFF